MPTHLPFHIDLAISLSFSIGLEHELFNRMKLLPKHVLIPLTLDVSVFFSLILVILPGDILQIDVPL